jgi:single-stranded DNA-binding protein
MAILATSDESDLTMSGIEYAFFGALGRDAESKVSKAGKPYLKFSTRVGDGESAVWVLVMCFDERAIAAAEQMTKGARVYVEGRLEPTEWTGQDGAQRHGLSCMSWHARLAQIGRQKPKRERNNGTSRHSEIDPPLNDPIPF